MKIEAASQPSRAAVRRAARARGGRSFASHLESATAAAGVAGAEAVEASSLLLAAQEVPSAFAGRRRGHAILDRLDEIRDGLLSGSLSRAKVETLAREVEAERAEVADPRLAEVLDQIYLRAKVELAKYAR